MTLRNTTYNILFLFLSRKFILHISILLKPLLNLFNFNGVFQIYLTALFPFYKIFKTIESEVSADSHT